MTSSWMWLTQWAEQYQGIYLVGDAWFSTLMPPSVLVKHFGTVYLSLGGHGSGFLAWEVAEVSSLNEHKAWKLDASSMEPVGWHFVTDPSEWAFVGTVCR